MISTWRKQITEALEENGETWSDLVGITLTKKQLDVKFDAGYGAIEGAPFTAWTSKYVYFPASYDGSEWCDYVPRNPCAEETYHIGGG